MTSPGASFEVHVAKESFKFNAAHFVAFNGFRERLHGHNYTVGVRLFGARQIGSDGYLIDFGDVKGVVKRICKNLNEHFICPTLSDVMDITICNDTVTLKCQDGAFFSFPRGDCAMLPIVHATTEELAVYLYGEILSQLGADRLLGRGIHTMEVNVAEAPGQDATFRIAIPSDCSADSTTFDVRTYLATGKVAVKPCLETANEKSCCSCPKTEFAAQLEKLAKAINSGDLSTGSVTVEDLEKIAATK